MPCNAEFRDPTQPAYPLPSTTVVDGVAADELTLSAIWISSHSKRATINGVSGKQGQTIVVGPVSPLMPGPANTVGIGDKQAEPLNKALDNANKAIQSATLENTLAPPLAAAMKNLNIPQPQGQSVAPVESSPQQPPTTILAPASSNTIKIISIRKNSVAIDQNGKIKTLQLVQRPYKTNAKYLLK